MQWNKVLQQRHMQVCEKQNVSNELGDLPKENSKQVLMLPPGSFLMLIVKWEEKN